MSPLQWMARNRTGRDALRRDVNRRDIYQRDVYRHFHHQRWLWLPIFIVLYLVLTCYQLGLPGLHYDEAREAGVNALEILTGAPITAFREVSLPLFGHHWPVMVQDYIGALNIYLALPLLWSTGIGVPNLRFLAILIGLVTLLLVERAVTEWQRLVTDDTHINRSQLQVPSNKAGQLPISVAGLLAVMLLAASPTFVFWSRQGIFVTNLTQPLVMGSLWQGLCWLRRGRAGHLLWGAFLGGCALYAKLLAIWIIGPFVLIVAGWWLWQRGRSHLSPILSPTLSPTLSPIVMMGVVTLFLLPLLPLFWFNTINGGTLSTISGNLGTSYYGIDNLAIGANLGTRLTQLRQVIEGGHFWYLGGIFGNPIAFWGGTLIVLIALIQYPRLLLAPLLLLLAALAASLFTISDLFITHYALIQPFAVAIVALAFYVFFFMGRRSNGWNRVGYVAIALWLLLDLTATLQYHGALARSGGLADHSDASYHLAYHLRYNGLGAPIALDWGFDAPVRYLSEGRVRPIEVFGYESPGIPDEDFTARLQPFLENPDNVYLLHTPQATVFAGRREVFFGLVSHRGVSAQLEMTFTQRDGTPLYELWRVIGAN